MKKVLAIALALAMVLSLAPCCFAANDGITIALTADIDTLHPSDYSTTEEINVLNQLYDTLMYMNPDGAHEPEARIAESCEVSEDGMTYTFKLRSDATFHDGSKITAEDVVFSIGLFQNSDYQSWTTDCLDHAEVIDDTTVACYLENPYAPFMLGICNVRIASKAYYEQDAEAFASSPIGSGPYKFVSRTEGSKIVLEAYEGYYRGAASIKNVTFDIIGDASTMAVALLCGKVNFAEVDASVLLQLEASKDITIQRVDTSSFTYVVMNLEQAPFDNVLVRQAINYAIDRDNIVAVCYDGEATANSNIMSTTRMGYSEDQVKYDYNPEKAIELLAEAGIATPCDLGSLMVTESNSALAAVVQENLKAVGLNVTIEVREKNSLINDLRNGNFVMGALGMTLDGDTQSMEYAFASYAIGMANLARYANEDIDAIFAQTVEETDLEARTALFEGLFATTQEEAIYCVLCNPLDLYGYSAKLNVPEIAFEGSYFVYDFSM